jgi:hypothetical protein
VRARSTILLFAGLTVVLCAAGYYLASAAPDGLERIAIRLGFAHRERAALTGPLADYQFPWLASPALRRTAAALLGALVCFLALLAWGRYSARKSRVQSPKSKATRP